MWLHDVCICLLFILSLSVTLPFWWINVFISQIQLDGLSSAISSPPHWGRKQSPGRRHMFIMYWSEITSRSGSCRCHIPFSMDKIRKLRKMFFPNFRWQFFKVILIDVPFNTRNTSSNNGFEPHHVTTADRHTRTATCSSDFQWHHYAELTSLMNWLHRFVFKNSHLRNHKWGALCWKF